MTPPRRKISHRIRQTLCNLLTTQPSHGTDRADGEAEGSTADYFGHSRVSTHTSCTAMAMLKTQAIMVATLAMAPSISIQVRLHDAMRDWPSCTDARKPGHVGPRAYRAGRLSQDVCRPPLPAMLGRPLRNPIFLSASRMCASTLHESKCLVSRHRLGKAAFCSRGLHTC